MLFRSLVGIFVLTQAFGKRLSQFTADPVSYTHLDVYKRQVGGSNFPVQVSDIRLDTTLFHLPDSSPLMDSGDNIKPLSGIGTQVHTLRAVIGLSLIHIW